MEKEWIGTKATRAEIISTLFKRNYIIASQNLVGIEVTDLRFAVIEIMKNMFQILFLQILPELWKTI
jgi:DNA topoisomerase IA